MILTVSNDVDLYLIIEQTTADKLKRHVTEVALGIFNMIGFVNFDLASKFYAL